MINLLVGLQGSGKTYYAVAEIWKHIKKMHQAEISGSDYKYKKIYTNIEGLVPNRYVEVLDVSKLYEAWEWELKQYKRYEARYAGEVLKDVVFTPKVKHTHKHSPVINIDVDEIRVEESTVDNIEVFENNDQKLFESIKDPDASLDPDFIHYTLPEFERRGFVHCLIVIDEAHNFFGGGLKPAWKRLLSYHRHYHDQDYLLISQDNKMFNMAVCQLASYTIRAINPIMRWRKDIFTYNVYSGGWISFSGDNKLETKSLKAKELIFALYNSGGKKLSESHFLKIVLKLLLGLVLVGAWGYHALTNFGHDKEMVKVEQKKDENLTIAPAPLEIIVQEPKKTVEIFLIVNNSIIHSRTGNKFMLESFNSLITEGDNIISQTSNLDGTTKVYYQLSDQTITTLNIKEQNENHYNNFGNN